jgi:hypothetical protein
MNFKIYLQTISDVKEVAAIASTIPEQVEVVIKSGTYVVDAKSLMGIFSLNLSEPVTLHMESICAVNYEYYKSLFDKWICVGEE